MASRIPQYSRCSAGMISYISNAPIQHIHDLVFPSFRPIDFENFFARYNEKQIHFPFIHPKNEISRKEVPENFSFYGQKRRAIAALQGPYPLGRTRSPGPAAAAVSLFRIKRTETGFSSDLCLPFLPNERMAALSNRLEYFYSGFPIFRSLSLSLHVTTNTA